MGKLLVLVLLVVAAVWLIRQALRAQSRHTQAPPERRESSSNPEELVRCAHCRVLLPRAEARSSGGVLYCSEEHARLGPGAP